VQSERGLPQYFDCLVREMERQSKGPPNRSKKKPGPHSTAPHGEELNSSLDAAIADAVTGFAKNAGVEDVDSAYRMGFLVHELRNALTAAILAHSMVESGVVGIGSSTNALLGRNLDRMRGILDHAFSELRIHSDKTAARPTSPR
jgi:hypothetical protein